MDITTGTGPGVLGAIAGGPGGASATRPPQSQLSQEEFYKIMVAELTNQDPLNPLDNQDFLSQVSSLQSLELTNRLSDGIEALIFQQSLGAASSLIGREIKAVADEGIVVTGRVQKVAIQGDTVRLALEDGRQVPFRSVVEINA